MKPKTRACFKKFLPVEVHDFVQLIDVYDKPINPPT
jgi:hypothetical protein